MFGLLDSLYLWLIAKHSQVIVEINNNCTSFGDFLRPPFTGATSTTSLLIPSSRVHMATFIFLEMKIGRGIEPRRSLHRVTYALIRSATHDQFWGLFLTQKFPFNII
jgi:hypothetical protein